MTPVAIASLVTGLCLVTVSIFRVRRQRGADAHDDLLLFGGLFSVIWATAYLAGL